MLGPDSAGHGICPGDALDLGGYSSIIHLVISKRHHLAQIT